MTNLEHLEGLASLLTVCTAACATDGPTRDDLEFLGRAIHERAEAAAAEARGDAADALGVVARLGLLLRHAAGNRADIPADALDGLDSAIAAQLALAREDRAELRPFVIEAA